MSKCYSMIKKMEEFKDYPDSILQAMAKDLEGLADMHERMGSRSEFARGAKEWIKERKIALENLEALKRQTALAKSRTRNKMAGLSDNPALALRTVLGGDAAGNVGEAASIKSAQEAHTANYLKLTDTAISELPDAVQASVRAGELDLERMQAKAYLEDPKYAEYRGWKLPDNPVAVDLAKKHLLEDQAMAFDMGRARGYKVDGPQGRIISRTHDAVAIMAQPKNQWIDKILSYTDLPRTFKENSGDLNYIREYFSDMYERIRTSNYQDTTKGRAIHFSSPEAEFKYMQEFGYGSLDAAREAAAREMGARIPLAEAFGWDYEAGFQEIRDATKRDLRPGYDVDKNKSNKLRGAIPEVLANVDTVWAEVTGVTNQAGTSVASTVSTVLRGANVVSKLGNTGIRSASNLATATNVTQNLFDKGWGHALADNVQNFISSAKFGEADKIMRKFGLLVQDVHKLGMADLSTEDAVGSVRRITSAITRGFTKATGLDWMNKRAAAAMSLTIGREFAELSVHNFDELGPMTKQTLTRYGLSSKHWEVAKRMISDLGDGTMAMVPNRYMDPDIVTEMLGVSKKKAQEIIVDTAIRLNSMVYDASLRATTTPDVTTNAMLRQGLHADRWGRIAMDLAFQFKSFSAQQLSGMRDSYRLQANVKGKIPALLPPLQLAMGMTALWFAGQKAIDMASGKPTRKDLDPTTALGMARIFAKSGASGIMGDYADAIFGFGEDSGTLKYVAGPTFGTANDLANIVAKKVVKGESTEYAQGKVIRNNLPFQNFPGLTRVYDPAINMAMEKFWPHYVEKRRMQDVQRELEGKIK